jgi:hypothetical protein
MMLSVAATSMPLVAQDLPPAVTVSGLDNQIFVGYAYTKFDYEILTADGDKVLTTSGASIQYNNRVHDHLIFTGMVNYGSGSPAGQTLTTIAFGAGVVQPVWRLEPYGQFLAGVARLTSTDDLYLSSSASTSFTYLLEAGVDLTLRGRWGLRPIYVQSQYLSLGPIGSNYRTIGSGVLYRFGSTSYGRHIHGR